MFIENPWTKFATVATIILVIYYTWVIWRFYLDKIKAMIKNGKHPSQQPHQTAANLNGESGDLIGQSDPEENQHGDESDLFSPETGHMPEIFEMSQRLCEHLTVEIKEASEKDYPKADLLLMIQMILRDYKPLKSTPFQQVINNRIQAECAKYGSVHIHDNDKSEFWSVV